VIVSGLVSELVAVAVVAVFAYFVVTDLCDFEMHSLSSSLSDLMMQMACFGLSKVKVLSVFGRKELYENNAAPTRITSRVG
jgi:hypothetical protein